MGKSMILPLARRNGVITEALQKERLIYDLETHKAHSLNPTASLVWDHCDGKRTYGEMARILADELDAPMSEELVQLAVSRLAAAGLIDTSSVTGAGNSISRRAVLSKLAIAGSLSVLLPVVHSIVAPTPAEAQTCVNPGGNPPGAPCTVHAQCCTNHCIPGQGVCR